MIKRLWEQKVLLLSFLASFVLYFGSLFVFYTNDDFFLLKISKFDGFGEFLNFFSLIKGPEGLGMYRPLTIQVFYSLAWKLFNLNPLGLHVVGFIVFFGVIYCVYKLIQDLSGSRSIASMAAFLYAVSATHFAHLYYLATFQETAVTLFVLLSLLTYVHKRYLFSVLFFILALSSKETAVVTPPLIFMVYIYRKYQGIAVESIKKIFLFLIPFGAILTIYMLFRIYSYGFATGDTYVWDFTIKKFVNTVLWYVVWALNMPETVLDFVGPGLKLNPTLIAYWPKQIIPIFSLFFIQGCFLSYLLLKTILNKNSKKVADSNLISIFTIAWFLVSLLPVVFLPVHKFTFYLTLPLVGLVFRIAYLLDRSKISNLAKYGFLLIWFVLAFLSVKHTYNTNWITQGAVIGSKVNSFFKENQDKFGNKNIYFVDTEKDKSLPWSPTQVVKIALSDKNFFHVFYPELTSRVNYMPGDGYIIYSRQFLSY